MTMLGTRGEEGLRAQAQQAGPEAPRADLLAERLCTRLLRLPGMEDVVLCIDLGIGAQAWPGARVVHPSGRLPAAGLAAAAAEARRLAAPVVAGAMPGAPDAAGPCFVAVPFRALEGGPVTAILSAELRLSDRASLTTALDMLDLALGWLRAEAAQAARDTAEAQAGLAASALGAVVSLAEPPRLAESLQALAVDLKDRFGCDRVSIGLAGLRRVRVRAISNAPQISRAQPLVRNLAAAMEEALDQDSPLLWPLPGSAGPRVTEAQAALAEADPRRAVFTVPMTAHDRQVGALVFERHGARSFEQAELETLEAVVTTLGPLLDEKRRNDRLLAVKALASLRDLAAAAIGRRHFAWKAAALGVAATIWALGAVQVPDAVKAEAVVEGVQQRLVSASFDGFIAEAPVREGDRVAAGDLLVRLDDREQALELLRLDTQTDETQLELDRAIGEQERAVAQILRARLDQIKAQRRLVEERMARMRMTAPFDAVVISGDLSRAVGRSVSRGEPLLTIAPAGDYRIRLIVDQSDADLVAPGLEGALRLTARPGQDHAITLAETLPVAQYADGRTTFAVEARFRQAPPEALHGMEGSARIAVGERALGAVWFGPLLDRARLWLWGAGLS